MKFKLFLVFGFLLLLTGCATVYNPATGKKEFVIINTQTEVDIGKLLSKRVALEYPLLKDQQLNDRLEKIGNTVARNSDRAGLEYHFFIIQDDDLNAFAIPGGYIYVHKGIMQKATDDELACVLAHEIAHIAARHPVKRLELSLGYQLVAGLALSRIGAPDVERAMDIIFGLVNLGYSRDDERLADKLAVKYAFRSKYNPNAMISFLNKLNEETKKTGYQRPPVFLSSHPDIEERIENTKKEIQRLEEKPSETNQEKPNIPNPSSGLTSKTEMAAQPKKTINKPEYKKAICPTCKRTYAPSYNFCPKDGTELNYY